MSYLPTLASPVIPAVVAQHVNDAAALRNTRTTLLRAPHVDLFALARADERLAAHLDGIGVAGDESQQIAQAALESPDVGAVFVAAVGAIERKNLEQIERLLALADVLPDARRALASAFGWVSPALLRGLTVALLGSPSPLARWLGIAACAQHRVDPGPVLAAAIQQAEPPLRQRALQAAGELGRVDLLPLCQDHLKDEDSACASAAAQAALMLGDRQSSVEALMASAARPHDTGMSLALPLFVADASTARDIVRQLAAQATPLRKIIRAAAWSGDAQVVPWLFKHMEDDAHARLAGEAFSFITGIDLAWLDLERKPPENVPGGPNDDPNDDNVALDEDESLPWPDLPKLTAWWHKNGGQFPSGTRLFAGAPPTTNHCFKVLKDHTQRRRMAAALYMSLLKPGSVLFNCAAPTRRQERLLAQMES